MTNRYPCLPVKGMCNLAQRFCYTSPTAYSPTNRWDRLDMLTPKRNKAKTWGIVLSLASFGCQPQPTPVSPSLPANFKLAGHYQVTAIQIDPPLQAGQDIMAMYADSTGQSPCLSDATIEFNSAGWIAIDKPTGCEQNNDLTEITGLRYGEKWALEDDNTLVVKHFGNQEETQYSITASDKQIVLNRDIDRGYASSLDDNPSGYTLTIELKRKK